MINRSSRRSENFNRAFIDLMTSEGEYTVDKGGPTMYGVTQTVARETCELGQEKHETKVV